METQNRSIKQYFLYRIFNDIIFIFNQPLWIHFQDVAFSQKVLKEINGNNEKLVNLYDMYKNVTPITYKED